MGLALDRAADRVATEQQVGLARQIARLDHLDQLVLLVQQLHLGAGGDVQACLDGIAIAQRDADTGVGTDQAAFADGDDDVAATGQGAHGRAAAAQVRTLADEHAGRDAAFDHAWAFGAGVKVDEALVHDGGAFADVGTQANPRAVGDAHTGRDHVVGHLRELVHREHFQQVAAQACFELLLGQFGQVDGALAGPGDVRQQREDAGQAHAMGLDQAVREQVQLQVGFRGRGQRAVLGQQGRHQRLLAFRQAGQQGGLSSVDRAHGFGQLRRLGGADGDGLVAAFVAQYRGDRLDQGAGGGHQRQRVEDFQPGALAVLGADAEGQAEQGSGHAVTSCE